MYHLYRIVRLSYLVIDYRGRYIVSKGSSSLLVNPIGLG